MKLTLPTDSAERKEYSIGRGCLAYFPAAIAGVARHSFKAGAKHTEGALVHKCWLSSDHDDCIERHLMDLRDIIAYDDRNPPDDAARFNERKARILDEANALAWRALALSQELHEAYGGAPLAPAARLSGEENSPSNFEAYFGSTQVHYESTGAGLMAGAAISAAATLGGGLVPRCQQNIAETEARCMKPSGHGGKHDFTGEASLQEKQPQRLE